MEAHIKFEVAKVTAEAIGAMLLNLMGHEPSEELRKYTMDTFKQMIQLPPARIEHCTFYGNTRASVAVEKKEDAK